MPVIVSQTKAGAGSLSMSIGETLHGAFHKDEIATNGALQQMGPTTTFPN